MTAAPLQVLLVGELTVDDVVVEDQGYPGKQVGGGALYSAIGARLWGTSPSICATVGPDFPRDVLEELGRQGCDTSTLTWFDRPSLAVWLLYERAGRRHQVQKASGSTFAEVDEARAPLPEAEGVGVHIAPQTTEGQLRALAELRGSSAVVTLDLMIEPFIATAPYTTMEALRGLSAFLPSEQEVGQLWGAVEPGALAAELRARAGVDVLVVKRGAAGADVVTGEGAVRVPAVSAEALDTTGAGDAFCGGFLAGLVRRQDPVDAAVLGAVSASFVVETHGALAALRALDRDRAEERAHRLRTRLEPCS